MLSAAQAKAYLEIRELPFGAILTRKPGAYSPLPGLMRKIGGGSTSRILVDELSEPVDIIALVDAYDYRLPRPDEY